MPGRLPSSTLFPYTTLFRSRLDSCCGGANKFMREIRRFTAIGLADAFLRAVARAIADFACRSVEFGKTKGRIMKTTLLLTALLCWSAHADFTADIYKTRRGA